MKPDALFDCCWMASRLKLLVAPHTRTWLQQLKLLADSSQHRSFPLLIDGRPSGQLKLKLKSKQRFPVRRQPQQRQHKAYLIVRKFYLFIILIPILVYLSKEQHCVGAP